MDGPGEATQSSSFSLPSDYDATEAYYSAFSKRDVGHSSTLAASDGSQLLASARSTLSEKPTPRQLSSGFGQFELAIETERDPRHRRMLIQEYEHQKDALDRNNPHDAEAARFYLGVARDERVDASQRLEYYRRALAHTNATEAKAALLLEYKTFGAQFVRPTVI